MHQQRYHEKHEKHQVWRLFRRFTTSTSPFASSSLPGFTFPQGPIKTCRDLLMWMVTICKSCASHEWIIASRGMKRETPGDQSLCFHELKCAIRAARTTRRNIYKQGMLQISYTLYPPKQDQPTAALKTDKNSVFQSDFLRPGVEMLTTLEARGLPQPKKQMGML